MGNDLVNAPLGVRVVHANGAEGPAPEHGGHTVQFYESDAFHTFAADALARRRCRAKSKSCST